jgi:hypothetical protein
MLTIYEIYYKNYENQPFFKLRKIFPIMILYYKTISYSELDEIRKLWRFDNSLMKKIFYMKGYNRKDFINHYEKMIKEYENLFEFLDEGKFFN